MKAVLEILTWEGYDPSASHYYGKLWYYDKEDKLQREDISFILGQSHVKKLNKQSRKRGDGFKYYVGTMSERFFSEEQLIKAAGERTKELGLKIMLVGNFATSEPMKVGWCADLKKWEQLNTIYQEFEPLDWDDIDDELTMEELSQTFRDILESLYYKEA